MTTPQLFQCLRYRDASAAIDFVTALGFQERLIVRDTADPAVIQHAQFRWRDNGGVMFGTDRPDGIGPAPGTGCTNIVVAEDADVDALLAVSLRAGAHQLNDVTDAPHGGRNVAVSDPEGNIWNIDSYPGE